MPEDKCPIPWTQNMSIEDRLRVEEVLKSFNRAVDNYRTRFVFQPGPVHTINITLKITKDGKIEFGD